MEIKIYIKHLDWTTKEIESINFALRKVYVWLTGRDEGDPSEYDFEEVDIILEL